MADTTHLPADANDRLLAEQGAAEHAEAAVPPDDLGSALPTRKLVASGVVGVLVFALTKLAIPVDVQHEQALNVLAMLVAGYVVPNDPSPGGVPER